MIKCQVAEDPSLWSDFPVKLTIGNMDSFFEIKRSAISFSRYHGDKEFYHPLSILQSFFEVSWISVTRLGMVRSVEIQLPVCTRKECVVHPVKEWPVLNQISDFLAPNLDEIIIRGAVCDVANPLQQWISIFARERKEEGITICMVWPEPDESTHLDFWLSAATSESGFINLLTRTVRGEGPIISINGGQDAARSLPANFFQLLSGLAEDGRFYLSTDYKIKSLDHLENCLQIILSNRAAIEEEEVVAWEGILAHAAQLPRPRNLWEIVLPKVKQQQPLFQFSVFMPLS